MNDLHTLEGIIIQLQDHIARNAMNEWVVTTRYDEPARHFSDYRAASDYFDTLPDDAQPQLVLYTRLGSMAVFRWRSEEGHAGYKLSDYGG